MSNHVKNTKCFENEDKKIESFDFKDINFKQETCILYEHNATRLFCADCNWGGRNYGLTIGSLQQHFKDSCRMLPRERKELMVKRNKGYYNKKKRTFMNDKNVTTSTVEINVMEAKTSAVETSTVAKLRPCRNKKEKEVKCKVCSEHKDVKVVS